jgi:hypothetical protein
MIFLNLVQILATSKLWSEPIPAPITMCTTILLFLNRCFKCV